MRLTHDILTLHTTHPFVIARGGYPDHRTVWVRLTDDDGVEGWGEAAPNRFYGETVETVLAAFARFTPLLASASPFDLESVERALDTSLRGNPSAKSAISAAMHDLAGKKLGVPVWKMWGLDAAKTPRSSFTIAIADRDALRDRVAAAAEYPILKVKLGTDRDEEIVRTVRDAAPDKILRVDANAAWTPKHAVAMIERLRDYDIEFVEQPVAAHDIDGMRFVRERSPLPIIADESCLVASDIPRLAGAADGINIKLAKCGGLREAVRMIHVARALGMRVMAGCMIESSLGISAAAQFAPLLDDADFDGAALLSDDPFTGCSIARGIITLNDAPGLGVARAR